MSYWRMFMNAGTRGEGMWKYCRDRSIAAIGYWVNGKQVVGDCSKISEQKYNEIWRRKDPHDSCGRSSLRKLAYEMRRGDTIYAAEKGKLVGRGRVVAPYKYDPNILKGTPAEWPHYVKVKWNPNFKERKNPDKLRSTVLKLNNSDLRKAGYRETKKLRPKKKSIHDKIIQTIEAEEGKAFVREVKWRSRNQTLIDEKKSSSDYRCEVCGMRFEDVYGNIGKKHIVAHHKKPLGRRKAASRTTLTDIALVCANCHAMLHKKSRPYKIQELRKRLRKKHQPR